MRVLKTVEHTMVGGGMRAGASHAPLGGFPGGGGGGYAPNLQCITAQQAQVGVNFAKQAVGILFGSAGAGLAKFATGGWSQTAQTVVGSISTSTMNQIGQYAGQEMANSTLSAYDDVINTINYANTLEQAAGAGATALSWANYSYTDSCDYSGESTFEITN